VITTDIEFPRAGGLLATGIDRLDSNRYNTTYVDKILKGAKPADLPMKLPVRCPILNCLPTPSGWVRAG
jgi:putative ABC transport system substrate-binding protein